MMMARSEGLGDTAAYSGLKKCFLPKETTSQNGMMSTFEGKFVVSVDLI
jgi:hypothetical protein